MTKTTATKAKTSPSWIMLRDGTWLTPTGAFVSADADGRGELVLSVWRGQGWATAADVAEVAVRLGIEPSPHITRFDRKQGHGFTLRRGQLCSLEQMLAVVEQVLAVATAAKLPRRRAANDAAAAAATG